MACYYPQFAFRTPSDGAVRMVKRGDVSNLTLACGRCIGCRVEHARQWTVRIMHEAMLYEENCFVTLTYNAECCPSDGSLTYRPFQLFMKGLRNAIAPRMVRFYMCGEYGDEKGRPHFHAVFFNFGFLADRYIWRDFGSGHVVYRSPLLERLWPFGDSSIGELTHESANYVARYVMKKVYGDAADKHYEDVDPTTGELTWRKPEFTRMSLNPGIGAYWFRLFSDDVFPHDRVVSRGRESKPPRYYDQLFKRLNAPELERIKVARIEAARERWPDNTVPRLAVREVVAKARVASYRRKLK